MASAEMPGASTKSTTPAPASKKQNHLVAGRRKFEEYRRKKAEEKRVGDRNNTADKPIANDGHEEGIFANGSDLGTKIEGNGKETDRVLLSSTAGVEYDLAGGIASSSSSTNHESVLFKSEESNSVVSDGPLRSSILDNSWKRSSGDLPGLRTDSLHESSMALPLLKQQADTPALNLASSSKDEIAGSGQEELVPQFRSSVLSNGMKLRGPKEPQFFFAQSKKSSSSDLGERESLFSSRPLDKSPFQPLSTLAPANLTASAAVSATSNDKGGPPLSLSASDLSSADAFSDQAKGLKSVDQNEGRENHAKNDDFIALEQHIDDLTQEKFSLQRALDAARSLAESLSQQNSVLTEDFNSQGAIINQLQAELEKKKEEVTSQSQLVLSSLMMERERAQQENNSAVERSQILAGEVIGLEEKVLKLRSSELKLQRELEKLKSDNDSFRLHSATLEKDRQNLRSMLEALQEDKKLLHSQLQKIPVSGDGLGTLNPKEVLQIDSRDASTSTDDLEVQTQDIHTTGSVVQRHASGPQLPETLDNSSEASSSIVASSPHSLGFGVLPALARLSADDFRAVNNIDVLITELISEKEALLEAVKRESTKALEFQALNTELSKKLETQTQRLELVVAQNMAHGGNAIGTNSIEIEPQYNDYVDEGDEVVERVLGWIMRLFPGGSSRRPSSKQM